MNATQGPTMPLSLNVNGLAVAAEIEPRRHLADFLRENLNLTGTHLGCEHGVCGACTLLVDGEPVRSCITFAGACSGADVTTIEGLDNDEIAIELRAAFNREHALQCGFCTPGMLVSARDLVLRLREPDERRIRLGLSGNLCRCTGYVGIVQAVRSVIAARRERGITAIVADPGRGLGPIGARIGSGLAAGAPTPKSVTARVPAPAAKVAAAFTPTDSFEQTFTIGRPPAEVFAAFGRIREIADCIPGAVVERRAGPEPRRGRHSRQIRADIAGLPRGRPRRTGRRKFHRTNPGDGRRRRRTLDHARRNSLSRRSRRGAGDRPRRACGRLRPQGRASAIRASKSGAKPRRPNDRRVLAQP